MNNQIIAALGKVPEDVRSELSDYITILLY